MKLIVFIVPSIDDSHYRNRIIEFIQRGYQVEVYGFCRLEKEPNLPYEYQVLGCLKNSNYFSRVKLYFDSFKKLGKKYMKRDVVFFLCGLDIAIAFHYLNPRIPYIYEECDLVHTYMGKLKHLFEIVDKQVINKSLLTITTSEGFINYHFNGIKPNNVCLVENKLNPTILEYEIEQKSFDEDKLSIGFVGAPRFNSIYNFIEVYCRNFPNYTFHIYGGPVSEKFRSLEKYKNCIFHGFFKNPVDLPSIYKNIDLVLSTYDTRFENIRYAEPNKIYECIYFETPIIVSSGTFLAEKVNSLGIGYDVDAMNDNAIINFVRELSYEDLGKKIMATKSIDKNETLNINNHLFERLKGILQ